MNDEKHENVELARYTDPDGVTWRVVREWNSGSCWLERLFANGQWSIMCDTGDVDADDLSPEEVVKDYAERCRSRQSDGGPTDQDPRWILLFRIRYSDGGNYQNSALSWAETAPAAFAHLMQTFRPAGVEAIDVVEALPWTKERHTMRTEDLFALVGKAN